MKRYVLLILVILALMSFWNYKSMHSYVDKVTALQGEVDSLKNVTFFYETQVKVLGKNINTINELILDSLNLEIKGYDSTLCSHDQQIRWLQWHVERLNKSNN